MFTGANPKAFAVSNPGKLNKQAARSHDVWIFPSRLCDDIATPLDVRLLIVLVQIKEKRLHVPLVDRLPEEAPPVVVAVVGPPGVSEARETVVS